MSSFMRFILNSSKQSSSIFRITRVNLTTDGRQLSEAEAKIQAILKTRFPKANQIQVEDISGGCGSMYEVFVETNEFKDIRMVKRHQLINEALKNEIKGWHGIRISAYTPDETK